MGRNWTSEASEDKHFDEHGYEISFDTIEEYSVSATKFASSKDRGIKAFKARNGST